MRQVEFDHYQFNKYVDEPRWSSYFQQVEFASSKKYERILVIGKGDNIVTSILLSLGKNIKTYDCDASLNPDYLGDIREFDKIINGDRFDLIICCQVLEHIEFKHFNHVLNMMSKHSNDLLMSLPYCHHKFFELSLKILKFPLINLRVLVPKFYKRWIYDGQHMWEIGCKDYSIDRINFEILKTHKILKNYILKKNSYHFFFECSSKYVPR